MLIVEELVPAGAADALAPLSLLPQPAATSATSGTATAAERKPRGLLRVMFAPSCWERAASAAHIAALALVAFRSAARRPDAPSLPTSGETLTIRDSLTSRARFGACWDVAGQRI